MTISADFSIFAAGHLIEVTVHGFLLGLSRAVAANHDIDTTESEDFFNHPIELVESAGYL